MFTFNSIVCGSFFLLIFFLKGVTELISLLISLTEAVSVEQAGQVGVSETRGTGILSLKRTEIMVVDVEAGQVGVSETKGTGILSF